LLLAGKCVSQIAGEKDNTAPSTSMGKQEAFKAVQKRTTKEGGKEKPRSGTAIEFGGSQGVLERGGRVYSQSNLNS